MKLATERTGGRDGQLVVVSRDNSTVASAGSIVPTLRQALENWEETQPLLDDLYQQLNNGLIADAGPFLAADMAAPLPRAWQWLDASAYPSHGVLMQRAYNQPPIPTDPPLMYQGMSHQFLGATDAVRLPSEEHGIDFEGEFGVITGEVPIGTSANEALHHMRLLVQINDWSLRVRGGPEMKTGFGWISAKPACSVAPIAITPDELGPAWRDGRIHARLDVQLNGERFGAVPSGDMQFGFHELIGRAAETRTLCAGTIIGSGTVSSPDYETTGSCCIAERRAIENIELGSPRTSFMKFGDRVRMAATVAGLDGSPFGIIDQEVVSAS